MPTTNSASAAALIRTSPATSPSPVPTISASNSAAHPSTATSIDVIANFFQVLGVQPAMGRTFTAEDARNGAPQVILLSDAWWRRQFNADPNIVGKAFDMNGHARPPSSAFCPLHSTSTQSLRPAPRSMPSRRSISTGLRVTGATSSLRSGASSPASPLPRLWAMPLASPPHVLEQQATVVLRRLQRPRCPRSAEAIHRRQAAPITDRSLVRGRRYPSHRLRQPLQSPPRPLCRPLQGIRHARRSRRKPRSHRAPVA